MISRRSFLLGTFGAVFQKKVLVNPGHNKEAGGTSFPGVGLEYLFCTDISRMVVEDLRRDGVYAVLSRDENKYHQDIVNYELANRRALNEIIYNHRSQYGRELSSYELRRQLSILKFSENFHAMVSVHLNSIPSKSQGKIRGFSVGFSSHNAHPLSCDLARSIHSRLGESFSPSNNLGEQLEEYGQVTRGLMDKKYVLTGNEISIVKVPSVLVECGYIHEKYAGRTIADKQIRVRYAEQISKGIFDFVSVLSFLN